MMNGTTDKTTSRADAVGAVASEAAVISGHLGLSSEWAALSESYREARWYAAHTSANHEKRVAEQLKIRQVEHFLPLYVRERRWRDRRMTLQTPLFPGDVFVRIALQEKLQVQQISGVARLVGFNGTPAALPENEIETLKTGFCRGIRAEPHRYLTAGRRVRVKSGPMSGLEGNLIKRKKRARFVVSVDLIRRAMAVEIDEADLELIS